MRKCTVCAKEKHDEEFHKRKIGKNTICKDCRKVYIREHYKNNKEKYIQSADKSRKKLREWMRELKKTLNCSKCGENHIACLDFHHIDPSSKVFTIGTFGNHSREEVEKEIKKCIVLCSNCHRKLHYKE